MEILSDTTFRGATTFQKTVNVVGNLSVGSLCLSSSYITRLCSSDPNGYYHYYLPNKHGSIALDSTSVSIGSFTNKTIPSGCKKFTMTYHDLVSFGNLSFDGSKPHTIQIRKTSTGETMDMLVNITGKGVDSSEFTFERSSTNEIPENYFRTTVVGYLWT